MSPRVREALGLAGVDASADTEHVAWELAVKWQLVTVWRSAFRRRAAQKLALALIEGDREDAEAAALWFINDAIALRPTLHARPKRWGGRAPRDR